MEIAKKFQRFLSLVRMKEIEKFFLDNQKKTDPRTENHKKLCLFQIPMDYYFLLMSKLIIYEKDINLKLVGSWPYYFKPFKKKIFLYSIIQNINSKIFYYFLKKNGKQFIKQSI